MKFVLFCVLKERRTKQFLYFFEVNINFEVLSFFQFDCRSLTRLDNLKGIVALKATQLRHLVLSDYDDKVLNNLKENLIISKSITNKLFLNRIFSVLF
jgi:hypothetical protein